MCVCVFIFIDPWCKWGGQRRCRSGFSPSAEYVSRFELRSLGLAASAFIQWSTSLIPLWYLRDCLLSGQEFAKLTRLADSEPQRSNCFCLGSQIHTTIPSFSVLRTNQHFTNPAILPKRWSVFLLWSIAADVTYAKKKNPWESSVILKRVPRGPKIRRLKAGRVSNHFLKSWCVYPKCEPWALRIFAW